MTKLNHRNNWISNTLLVIVCALCLANTVIADSDEKSGPTKDDSVQKYAGSVQAKIQANWKPTVENRVGTICPTVRFTILPTGQAVDIRISHSSNKSDIDSSAIMAIKTVAPFPPITISPYDKDGLPIEMEVTLNVQTSDNIDEVSIAKIISQADKNFDKGDWSLAIDTLNAGLAKYPNNARLKSYLSDLYLDQANILLAKSSQSAAGIQLAKKALSLNPNNSAAQALIRQHSPAWQGLLKSLLEKVGSQDTSQK